MPRWDQALEEKCNGLIVALCGASTTGRERETAWHQLMAAIAPHIEAWVRGSHLLRRSRLATEDDARTILVAAMTRLKAREYDNLRSYLARPEDSSRNPTAERTPLRAWLLGLVRFLIKDHVEQRFGAHGKQPVDQADRQPNKRDLGTDAARFDELIDAGQRPPMTDMLSKQQMMKQVNAHLDTFPPDMRLALESWLRGDTFEEIAAALKCSSADDARALVRAAQGRLRNRMRGT